MFLMLFSNRGPPHLNKSKVVHPNTLSDSTATVKTIIHNIQELVWSIVYQGKNYLIVL